MKRLVFAIMALLLLSPRLQAIPDEGMWLPMFIERLNYVDMEKMGLNLTPEEIYNINNSSLKDAVVIFGGGCTGEMISEKGLLITNHHCGYGQIQAHSSVDHDYLKNGFWAKNMDEELKNEGLTVKFLIRMEDVTKQILEQLDENMSPLDRARAVAKISKEIEEKEKGESSNIVNVKEFFAGNEYYMFVYQEYKDVRLVGAPPSSVGKFGADTDNWMWPRHTGDFSLFRVYMSPGGEPANYSKDNIPMKPKHFLPISLKPKNKGDFAMIMGYPGTTERYLTSYGIELALEYKNPSIVKIRTKKLDIMKEDMDASDEIRIKYASKYARTANYWKYYQGQSKGLKRLKVYDKKKSIEESLHNWMQTDETLLKKYGASLDYFQMAYDTLKLYEIPKWYFLEAIHRGAEIVSFAFYYEYLYSILTSDDPKVLANKDAYVQYLRSKLDDQFKDYHMATDKKLLSAMLQMYYEDVPAEYHPALYKDIIMKKFKGDYDAYVDFVFSKSVFPDKNRLEFFLNDPKAKTLEKDPAYVLTNSFVEGYRDILKKSRNANFMLAEGNRLFIAGLRQMQKDKVFYPDANFTMRLTYGTVQDYYPADAVHFDYFTTLDGVMEKEDPDNWEFIVHDNLKALYEAKDYGPYGENGEMVLCFLTNHDITGGNSGSPVLDGDGNLIGLAFDGNWEAMSGDIAFEPELQRTINVDIRYVLFIIDKFAQAKNIINELKIIQPEPEKVVVEEVEEKDVENIKEVKPVK
jgi:hypothetical protein